MNWTNFVATILILYNSQLYSQQVSISIPFGSKTHEYGWHIDELDGDFIITTSVRCKVDEDVPSEGCCAMIRVNGKGEVVWKKLVENETEYASRPGGIKSTLIQNDSIIVSGFVSRRDSLFFRIFIVNPGGDLLNQIDYYFPFFYWNSGIQALPDGYLVYNILRDTTEASLDYQFLTLDRAFNIKQELKIGKKDRRARDGTAILLDDGSILAAMEEWHIPQPGKSIRLIRLNNNMQLETENEINVNTIDFGSLTPIIQKAKDSTVFISHFKTFERFHDTALVAITIYKYNASDVLIWEKPFRIYRDQYISSDFHIGSNENLYLAGSLQLLFGGVQMGWFHKMDENGKTIWNRYYIDSSKKIISQFFYRLIERKNGDFTITGSIMDTFINHSPSEFNRNIWFVTLDKNGCFNGDCSDTIILNRKITTGMKEPSFDLDELLEFYPNPAVDFVNIKFREPKKRKITLINSQGKLVESIIHFGTNKTLDVSSYLPGSYYVKIEDDQGKFINIPLNVIH